VLKIVNYFILIMRWFETKDAGCTGVQQISLDEHNVYIYEIGPLSTLFYNDFR